MKVLWFTGTPSLYDQGKHNYHGCGWIESLEEAIKKRSEIKLALAFFHPTDRDNIIIDGVSYFPILRTRSGKSPIKAIINNWKGKFEQEDYQRNFMNIIDDFQPDVIQVFGTEGPFALIQELTSIPVLVHLQGLVNPYLNTYFPIGYSNLNFLFSINYLYKNLIGLSPIFNYKRLKYQAKREMQIFAKLKFVCGRTDWDRQITYLFNNDIKYFHIDEILRPIFYEKTTQTKSSINKKYIILSTLSPTIYKGIDIVLKAAVKLKLLTDFEFEWRIIGLSNSDNLLKLFEAKEGIKHQFVDIKILGVMSSDQIITQMLDANVFVHPSYIDNSPNSICEAQILGLPVIACNVGGVSSLVKHKETGILIPSNGLYELVYYLKLLKNDPELGIKFGAMGKADALQRHDKEKIVEKLISVYKEIN